MNMETQSTRKTWCLGRAAAQEAGGCDDDADSGADADQIGRAGDGGGVREGTSAPEEAGAGGQMCRGARENRW
jgi:hypothetical protein